MVGKRSAPKIATSITELIGNTPMLKLGRSAEGLDAIDVEVDSEGEDAGVEGDGGASGTTSGLLQRVLALGRDETAAPSVVAPPREVAQPASDNSGLTQARGSWLYVDDQGRTQGPFSTAKMRSWIRKAYLSHERLARPTDAAEDAFVSEP